MDPMYRVEFDYVYNRTWANTSNETSHECSVPEFDVSLPRPRSKEERKRRSFVSNRVSIPT